MSFESIVIGIVVVGFALMYWLLSQQLKQSNNQTDLEGLVAKVFGMSATTVAEQSKQVLAGEREAIASDLANKHLMIEKLVKQVQADLAERQDEIRSLERDRTKKFSEMSSSIDHHRQLTEQLKVSTEQLAKVLSNNQQRGAWGERIIEDLLRANGLVEGTHYRRQAKLGASSMRPDIMLLLPNDRVVAVDVKFPYSEMQKLAAAETKSGREGHLKQFAVDLKAKISQVAKYIDPEHATLDYAIMFVPNEAVFSFINQQLPDIVDEAMSKRVIMVSPFTFLIVARTVMESYRNFMMSDKLREVVQYVDEFVTEWTRFKEKFDKYGRSIQTLQTDYDELAGTRVRQMERKIEHIEDVRQGKLLAESKPVLET